MSSVGGSVEGVYQHQEDPVGEREASGAPPSFVVPPRRATVAITTAPIRPDSADSETLSEGDDDRMRLRSNRRPSAPASRMGEGGGGGMLMPTRRSTVAATSSSSFQSPRGRARATSGASGSSYPPTDYNDPQLATRTLMVYRFPREAQEVDLACRFGAFGPIEHVKVVYDPVTHLPRCYGFVRFCYRESCISALRACEEGKIMMDDPFGRTWHFEAKWARNARAAGEIDRSGTEKEPQPPLPVPIRGHSGDSSIDESRGGSLLPSPAKDGNGKSSSDESTHRPTAPQSEGPSSGATPGPPDPFAALSDADLALINAAASPVVTGMVPEVHGSNLGDDNSVQALSAKALEEAENLATSTAAAAAAAAAIGQGGTTQAELARLIETVFRAVRSSALTHLTGGVLGHSGGTPPSHNATVMHDFLSSMVMEEDDTPTAGGPASARGATNNSTR